MNFLMTLSYQQIIVRSVFLPLANLLGVVRKLRHALGRGGGGLLKNL